MANNTVIDHDIEHARSQSIHSELSKPVSILQPLDMEEAAPVRTKLRMGAILLALYVFSSPLPTFNYTLS